MKGLSVKSIVFITTLFSTAFLSSQTLAVNTNSIKNNLLQPAGCMGCHQGESVRIAENEIMSKSHQRHDNQQHSSQKTKKKKILLD